MKRLFGRVVKPYRRRISKAMVYVIYVDYEFHSFFDRFGTPAISPGLRHLSRELRERGGAKTYLAREYPGLTVVDSEPRTA